MQLQNLFQVGENVFDVSRRKDCIFGKLLIEDIIQNFQHPHVCTLRVKQLCRHNESC